MDLREKLIELLDADNCKHDCCEDCEYGENQDACIDFLKKSMADHLIANGVTVQEWIPVSDPPKEDERVLVWLGANKHNDVKKDTDRVHNGRWVRWGDCVTHWMPLNIPEPTGKIE